jgi:uncharacterized protein involved in tolerance to divalent cations
MIFVYFNCKNKEDADAFLKRVFDQKLAVWVDVLKPNSIYIDDNKINKEERIVLILQTQESKLQGLEDAARELVKQDMPPAIASFSIYRLNREYKDWLAMKM